MQTSPPRENSFSIVVQLLHLIFAIIIYFQITSLSFQNYRNTLSSQLILNNIFFSFRKLSKNISMLTKSHLIDGLI